MDLVISVAALLIWMVLVSLSWISAITLTNHDLGMVGLALALLIVVVMVVFRAYPVIHRARPVSPQQ
jgi:hypothetical protein